MNNGALSSERTEQQPHKTRNRINRELFWEATRERGWQGCWGDETRSPGQTATCVRQGGKEAARGEPDHLCRLFSLTSYMMVLRFCWPALCRLLPVSLRCCLRSVSNWKTWKRTRRHEGGLKHHFHKFQVQSWEHIVCSNRPNQTLGWTFHWKLHQDTH